MTLRAEVDESICISSGKCVADAPSAFRFDDDEISEAIDGASAIDERTLIAVARNCPSGAIRVFDGDTVVPVD
jgi:ferredoxin